MKQNGFISSALLYGMLALFLVIMTSTLAILGNQKLGMDKLKENALNDIEYGYAKTENIYALYDSFTAPTFTASNGKWTDQSGNGHDATLYNCSYSNHRLNFNGTSYLNTGIRQSDLGSAITYSIVVSLKDITGKKGLWGYYDTSSKAGIYAYTDDEKYASVNQKIINVCYYTTNNEPLCIEIYGNYLNKVIQLTVVMGNTLDNKKGMEIYINDTSYDGIETNQDIKPYNGNLIIGKSSATDTNMMKADLYNVTIYNTALTYDDVQKNFEANSQRYNITS